MEAIEQQALQTYQANMDFFSRQHPELHKKLELFNLAIESGQYKERFALEYRGYFDILDLQTGHFLYGEDSTKISEKVAKEVHYKKIGNVIESVYNVRISKENAQTIHDAVALSDTPLYAAANIVHYVTETVPKESTSLKQLEKYIFLGVGIGKHLELIQKRVKSTKVWIVEDSLELFRLSLFAIEYAACFANTKLFFSVAQNEGEFKTTFDAFFTAGYNHNSYLKYTIFSDRYIARIKQIQEFIVTQDYLAYPYSMQLRNLLTTPEYLIEHYRYVNLLKPALPEELFAQKPVLIVAAGPSLKRNIEWLKANHDRFVIVSVLAALQTLYKHDIKPDIIVNIDASRVMQKFFDGVDVENFLADTLFLFSSMVNKIIVDKVKKENIYFFESTTHYKRNFGALTAPSVGETAYGLMLLYGAKELYLLGLDLALDPETGEKYANESHEPGQRATDESIYNTKIHDSVSHVKGNFVEAIPTLAVFKNSIHVFNSFSRNLKKEGCNVYNLNNGALLEGAAPTPISSVDVAHMPPLSRDSDAYRQTLRRFFDSRSEDHANAEDIAFLEEQLQEARRIYDVLIHYREKKSFSNVDAYLMHLARLINELLAVGKEQQFDINVIMYNYIRWVSVYIFELFYTKELTNPKKHIKYINGVLTSQVEKMLTLYIKTLQLYKGFAEEKLEKRNTES